MCRNTPHPCARLFARLHNSPSPLRATQPYYTNQAILERRRSSNTFLHPRLLDTRGSVSKSKFSANIFKSRCVHRTPSSFFYPAIQSLGATTICVLGGALLRVAGKEIEPGWIRAAKEIRPTDFQESIFGSLHQHPSSHAAATLCTPQRGSCS